MALKPNTPSRARSTTDKVRIRATDGEIIIQVSKETAEMLLRSKGDYELVDETGEKVSKKAGKKAGKKAPEGASGGNSEPTGSSAGALTKPVWPAGTADAWAAYAGQLGIATDGLDRNGIRDAVEAHEAKASE